MAKMDLTHFNFDGTFNGDQIMTVGHNRQIRKCRGPVSNRLRIACYLHGNLIATFERLSATHCEVMLSTCGYMTTTTRRAMNDFIGAMGIKGRVSFAGGTMTVRHHANSGYNKESENSLGIALFTTEYGKVFA